MLAIAKYKEHNYVMYVLQLHEMSIYLFTIAEMQSH